VCDSACYELVVRVFVDVRAGKAGKGPSVHSMRLCSCSWDARKWSCRSVWLKFLCIVSPSCSLLGSLAKRYKSFKIAEAHSCTWVSGIFEESCIAGVTIFIDSREFPKDKNTWPSRTRAQTVKRLRSSAFAILSVSLRYRFASLYLAAKNSWRPCM